MLDKVLNTIITLSGLAFGIMMLGVLLVITISGIIGFLGGLTYLLIGVHPIQLMWDPSKDQLLKLSIVLIVAGPICSAFGCLVAKSFLEDWRDRDKELPSGYPFMIK